MSFLGGVSSAEEGFDDFKGQFGSDDTGTDAQNVHIIVFDPLSGGVGVVAQASTNSWEFVSSDAYPDPGTADEDPPVDFPGEDFQGDSFCEIREIAGIWGVGAAVDGIDSVGSQKFGYFVLHRESRVIPSDSIPKPLSHKHSWN